MTLDAEWVSDQARYLLEDGQVSAFKVGDMGSAENAAAIAEIVADYPDVPLILAPTQRQIAGEVQDSEEIDYAIAELLVPQTSLLIAKYRMLGAYMSGYEGRKSRGAHDPLTTLAHLLSVGCEYVLTTESHEQSLHIHQSLYGFDEHDAITLLSKSQWNKVPHHFFGKTDTLATSVAALLANGFVMPEAVGRAQIYLQKTLLSGYRLGMGKLTPDRLFWAQDEEEDNPLPSLH